MLSLDIIEECSESRWISPVHVVLNESKEPRLTIDLRQVNFIRQRHHTPSLSNGEGSNFAHAIFWQ